MNDLSREEKLEQEILKMADECGNKKWMRVKRTFFILCGIIYLVAFIYGGIGDIKEFLWSLVGVPFIAGFIMFISSMVLLYITSGTMEDEKAIAKKIGELNAIKFNKYEQEVEK